MAEQVTPVLMYHSIATVERDEIMRSIHVSPKAFRRQMSLLRALGFRGCSLRDSLQASVTKGPRNRIVALTFDDGYLNFYTDALPILEEFGFTATIYVVSGLVGTSNSWDRHNGMSVNPLMDWEHLADCERRGMEIGCHSMSHQSLIGPDVDLLNEIVNAKSLLEQKLNIGVGSFCYPYGHHDPQTAEAVGQAGFKNATTMVRSRMRDTDDPYKLPRIPITWHTLPHLFLMKLITGYEDKRRYS